MPFFFVVQSHYSIIIPVFNEVKIIPQLLKDLEQFKSLGHEILIVDDGSNDGSYNILSKCEFISLIHHEKNSGKGIAIRNGLKKASNEKIVLFDGDRELRTKEIHNLMILDKNKNVQLVFATRKMIHNYNNFIWTAGNNFLTFIFNIMHNSNLTDALCCAKSFYKSDLNVNQIKSNNFDIDVEIACNLIQKKNNNYKAVRLDYVRRNKKQGKKLRLRDSLSILFRILTC